MSHAMHRAWAIFVLSLIGAGGCAHVPAYERGRLAHRTMAPGYADSAGRAHLQTISEGAAGGDQAPASGCGCN
jgi:hypothetical protein